MWRMSRKIASEKLALFGVFFYWARYTQWCQFLYINVQSQERNNCFHLLVFTENYVSPHFTPPVETHGSLKPFLTYFSGVLGGTGN